jgi:flagellar hook-basal body complex protein FliE
MPIAKASVGADLISAMRNLELKAQGATSSKTNQIGNTFADIFQQQIDNVNAAHKEVESLQERFVLGDEEVTLAKVKVAEMKATIYTKALTHVVGKMITAYHEVMNTSM